jgi:hypothetical protein
MDAIAPVRGREWVWERRRVRVFSRQPVDGSSKTPHLSPLPLRKGRGETNTIDLTIIDRHLVAEAT